MVDILTYITENGNEIALFSYGGSYYVLSVTRHLDFSIFWGCHLLFRMMTFFATDDGL